MTAVILVVDDQPAMLRNLRMGLEMSGYGVVTAVDGAEALAFLGKGPVDLVLADIAMPRMNGYQLYERMRENPKWALIPFVFLSARALDSDIRYGKALGVDDYLVKPFQLEDLLAIVTGRLRRSQELALATSARQKRSADLIPALEADLIEIGQLRISTRQHRVWQNALAVELSPREFVLLEYLARRPGEPVALVDLCRVTHGIDTNVVDAGNLLYPLIRSLRRRLGALAGDAGCIESVRGVGYRLAVPLPERV